MQKTETQGDKLRDFLNDQKSGSIVYLSGSITLGIPFSSRSPISEFRSIGRKQKGILPSSSNDFDAWIRNYPESGVWSFKSGAVPIFTLFFGHRMTQPSLFFLLPTSSRNFGWNVPVKLQGLLGSTPAMLNSSDAPLPHLGTWWGTTLKRTKYGTICRVDGIGESLGVTIFKVLSLQDPSKSPIPQPSISSGCSLNTWKENELRKALCESFSGMACPISSSHFTNRAAYWHKPKSTRGQMTLFN